MLRVKKKMLLKDVLEAIKIIYLSLISRHIFLTYPVTQSRNSALLTAKPGVLGQHWLFYCTLNYPSAPFKLVSLMSSLTHIADASQTWQWTVQFWVGSSCPSDFGPRRVVHCPRSQWCSWLNSSRGINLYWGVSVTTTLSMRSHAVYDSFPLVSQTFWHS